MVNEYINLGKGTEILGDEEIAKDLLSRFVRKLSSEMLKIKHLREEKQWTKLYDTIHKLLGAACYSSTPKIEHELRTIEAIIQPVIFSQNTSPDLKVLDPLLDSLDSTCKKTTVLCVKLLSSISQSES